MIKKLNPMNKNLPLFTLIILSMIVPWNLLLFRFNMSLSIFNSIESINSNNYLILFMYIFVIILTIFFVIIKPNLSITLSKLLSIVILVCFMITYIDINLVFIYYLLSALFLMLVISIISTYIYFFNYENIWKIFISSTIIFALFNLTLNNEYIFNIKLYKFITIIIFLLYSITLNIIKEQKIINKKIKSRKLSTKVSIGTFLVIILTIFIGSFAIIFSNYIKYGKLVLYISSIFSVLLILLLTKKLKIDKFHIINSYISISFIGVVLSFIPSLRLLACFFLSFGLVSYNMSFYLGNTLYREYNNKFIILFVILTNILIPILSIWAFNISNNNLHNQITLFFLIVILIFIILFTLMPFISSEYKKNMANKEINKYSPLLSKRENEIIKYILLGYTSGQITNELYISLPTVKTHISNIYKKLNINSKKQLFQHFNI